MGKGMDNTLRVQRLVGYGLEVPNLDVAEKFFGAFGLDTRPRNALLEMRSQNLIGSSEPAEILVMQGGAQKRLQHVAFGALQEDLPRFDTHLRSLGISPSSPSFGHIRDGLWFQDPWGTWICLVPCESPSPGQSTVLPIEPRVDRHLWQELNRAIKPQKLGHMLMFTQDWEKAESFLVNALGLRVADRAAGKVSFLSAGTGIRDHHCFGLINSTHRGFQHGSFRVRTLDDIGFGGLQMYKAGYREGFGVGRHALASNLFHYTRDPWGSWIEYYTDMDQISESWMPRDWNELPYVWPHWAPEFWQNEMNANLERA